MPLRSRIQEDMKAAMRAGDKPRLGTLRMLWAAVCQREVDERAGELDDAAVIAVVEKAVKQRREAADQYREAGRAELADKEQAELEVLREYLPQPLDESQLAALVEEAVRETGAASMKDMGKVMATLRARVQGRADMADVSARVKSRLAG
ncbi:MAG TPA: GatB/YqeY domain-containing protein [Gammaproteobacteria bacterium]|nr:GatB/YqeY domain-containing protein [Gammaproteobacteria bacterium]